MRVAITGGGSCFAINLAKHLTARGDEVLAIGRSPMRHPAFTLGVEDQPLFHYEQAHLVTELPKVMTALDAFRPTAIVNFAALCELNHSWTNATDYYETNLMALVRLTDELTKRDWFKHASRFMQIASSEVYGSVDEPATEDSPIRPSSPYAVSKDAFDQHLKVIAKHQGFPAVLLMPSNGYCEGQFLNRIIPKTIIACMTGTKIQLQGGGKAQKSYLHADDISSAAMLVLEKGRIGEVYNVGPDTAISIREIVNMLAVSMGKWIEAVADIAPERLGQDSMYLLDSSKIKALGWKQEVELEIGLSRVIHWIRENPALLTMDTTYRHIK